MKGTEREDDKKRDKRTTKRLTGQEDVRNAVVATVMSQKNIYEWCRAAIL